MNRKQKINLLQSLVAGRTKMSDLRDKRILIRIRPGIGQTRFYIDGNEVGSQRYREEIEKQFHLAKAGNGKIKFKVTFS